jgi:hypothetical protein
MMTKPRPIKSAAKTGTIPALRTLFLYKSSSSKRRTTNSTEQKNPISGMEKYFENLCFQIQDENGNSIDEKKIQ